MHKERTITVASGWLFLPLLLLLLGGAIWLFVNAIATETVWKLVIAIVSIVLHVILLVGFFVVNPNEAAALLPKDLSEVRLLVTAGATREALDPVRYLTNRSTGKMGFALARAAAARGARVTLVSGPRYLSSSPSSRRSCRSGTESPT